MSLKLILTLRRHCVFRTPRCITFYYHVVYLFAIIRGGNFPILLNTWTSCGASFKLGKMGTLYLWKHHYRLIVLVTYVTILTGFRAKTQRLPSLIFAYPTDWYIWPTIGVASGILGAEIAAHPEVLADSFGAGSYIALNHSIRIFHVILYYADTPPVGYNAMGWGDAHFHFLGLRRPFRRAWQTQVEYNRQKITF